VECGRRSVTVHFALIFWYKTIRKKSVDREVNHPQDDLYFVFPNTFFLCIYIKSANGHGFRIPRFEDKAQKGAEGYLLLYPLFSRQGD
jgi:hypothetical protein